jgi:hypothetical protein
VNVMGRVGRGQGRKRGGGKTSIKGGNKNNLI